MSHKSLRSLVPTYFQNIPYSNVGSLREWHRSGWWNYKFRQVPRRLTAFCYLTGQGSRKAVSSPHWAVFSTSANPILLIFWALSAWIWVLASYCKIHRYIIQIRCDKEKEWKWCRVFNGKRGQANSGIRQFSSVRKNISWQTIWTARKWWMILLFRHSKKKNFKTFSELFCYSDLIQFQTCSQIHDSKDGWWKRFAQCQVANLLGYNCWLPPSWIKAQHISHTYIFSSFRKISLWKIFHCMYVCLYH